MDHSPCMPFFHVCTSPLPLPTHTPHVFFLLLPLSHKQTAWKEHALRPLLIHRIIPFSSTSARRKQNVLGNLLNCPLRFDSPFPFTPFTPRGQKQVFLGSSQGFTVLCIQRGSAILQDIVVMDTAMPTKGMEMGNGCKISVSQPPSPPHYTQTNTNVQKEIREKKVANKTNIHDAHRCSGTGTSSIRASCRRHGISTPEPCSAAPASASFSWPSCSSFCVARARSMIDML